MATDLIRYDVLVQQALRSVVRKVLADGARDGLPGNHHFYISFDTNAPGVKITPRLHGMYPEEMTIVLQHQFWDLSVGDTGFEVSLSFDKIPERLIVPFDAVTGFFDPSVKFGLKFEAVTAEADQPVEKTTKGRKGSPRAKVEDKGEAAAEPVQIGRKGRQPKETPAPAAAAKEEPAAADIAGTADETAEQRDGSAQVVSLDAFRKKK